ncbi:hypothetical protein AX16_004266 [Volvariella volvacea WC 439]|nr:hypothetical protein AX16_004266 [Volvariella volvacea WC 439]
MSLSLSGPSSVPETSSDDEWFEFGVEELSLENSTRIYDTIAKSVSLENLKQCTLDRDVQDKIVCMLSSGTNLEVMVFQGYAALRLVVELGDRTPGCNDHEMKVIEGSTSELTNGEVVGCHECKVLGQSYFAGPCKLIFQHVELKKGWEHDRVNLGRSIHPIVELSVKWLRCGLGLEEIVFEEYKAHDMGLEEIVRQEFRTWCGDFGPSIQVI